MKHMATVKVPATTKQVLEKITCDVCGREIKAAGSNAEQVDVKHRTGQSFPEGGSGKETSVDMCGECFDGKLVPWLISQGATPRTEDWVW